MALAEGFGPEVSTALLPLTADSGNLVSGNSPGNIARISRKGTKVNEEAWKPGSSDPRNEALLRMFSMIDVGECAGSGMDKIFNGWVWAGYGEPVYEVERDPDRTTLTLPLAAESDDNRQIKSSDSLNNILDHTTLTLSLLDSSSDSSTGRIGVDESDAIGVGW